MHLIIDLSRRSQYTIHAMITIVSVIDGRISECALEDIANAVEYLRMMVGRKGKVLPPGTSEDINDFITGFIELGEVWDK